MSQLKNKVWYKGDKSEWHGKSVWNDGLCPFFFTEKFNVMIVVICFKRRTIR